MPLPRGLLALVLVLHPSQRLQALHHRVLLNKDRVIHELDRFHMHQLASTVTRKRAQVTAVGTRSLQQNQVAPAHSCSAGFLLVPLAVVRTCPL
ncbi:hypothetical protein T492DRAFT_1113772 [Pavlovales sp. CCMP2436]|nr:hypothetical protein T492DRAFT_1113772 [Pavlovales sp. CCMP2436]